MTEKIRKNEEALKKAIRKGYVYTNKFIFPPTRNVIFEDVPKIGEKMSIEEEIVSKQSIEQLMADPQTAQKIKDLLESFIELDAAIEPFQEQKKELRESYVKENQILTNAQFNLIKKAYNAAKPKSKTDMDALRAAYDIAAGVFKKLGV